MPTAGAAKGQVTVVESETKTCGISTTLFPLDMPHKERILFATAFCSSDSAYPGTCCGADPNEPIPTDCLAFLHTNTHEYCFPHQDVASTLETRSVSLPVGGMRSSL